MPLDPGIIALIEAFAPTTAKLVGRLLERGKNVDSDTVMVVMLAVMNENTIKLTDLIGRVGNGVELSSKKLDLLLER